MSNYRYLLAVFAIWSKFNVESYHNRIFCAGIQFKDFFLQLRWCLGQPLADRGGRSQGLVPAHGGDQQLPVQVILDRNRSWITSVESRADRYPAFAVSADSGPDPWIWWQDIPKNLQFDQNWKFLFQNLQYICPPRKDSKLQRKSQLSKENIQLFKNTHFFTVILFWKSFFHPNADTNPADYSDPTPQNCW